jgi:hypothetical protein
MKFHKHISLFLALFVLVSNIGFALNVHYCDNRIASVSFNTTSPNTLEEDCCGIVEQKSHCCSDKVVHFQKKSEQATIKSIPFEFHKLSLMEEWKPIALIPFSSNSTPRISEYSFHSNAPLLFKLYSHYIFYDQV